MLKFLLILTATISQSAFCADLLLKNNSNDCYHTMRINGEIRKGDGEKIINQINYVVKERKCKPSMVNLEINSIGGDVDESLKLGRFIRDSEYSTSLPDDLSGKCYSSCVFIFAGGVEKTSFTGEIGIHRTYFSALNDGLTSSQIKALRMRRIEIIKEYFNYVDIPISLIDLMMSIEPTEIRILTIEEKNLYRLQGTDATYEEKINARNASQFNMTSSEFRKRNAQADMACKHLKLESGNSPSLQCYYSNMFAISTQEAKKRIDRFNIFCIIPKVQDTPSCFKKYITLGSEPN